MVSQVGLERALMHRLLDRLRACWKCNTTRSLVLRAPEPSWTGWLIAEAQLSGFIRVHSQLLRETQISQWPE